MALPSGYVEIPYLESTGTQYINLWMDSSSLYQVEIDAEYTNDGDGSLFGTYDTVNDLIYTIGASYFSARTPPRWFEFTHDGYVRHTEYTAGRHLLKTYFTDGHLYFSVDGVDCGDLIISGSATFSSTRPYLFAYHLASSSQNMAWEHACARIYEVTILYSGGTIARHLIPAKRASDGALGMYDTKTDGFFTNDGSGSFITKTVEPPESITVPDGITIGQNYSVLWSASPEAGVTGYELERAVNGGSFTQVYSGTGLSCTDTAETGWETVQYRVRAVSGTDVSDWVLSEVRTVYQPPAATYTVTVSTAGHGTASASPISGASGTVVTLTATPDSGYRLREWIVLYGGVTIASNQFTIGSANVSVMALFEEIPQTVYNVTVTTDGNGTASASPASGVTGTEVTLTATPNSGYVLSSWQVLDGGVTISNNTFTIGTENVSIRANFAATGDILPPPTILVPSSIAVGDTYTISWEASPSAGVSYYLLQRYVNGSAYSLVNTTTGLSLTDTALSGWTSIQYRVRAVNTELQNSAWTTSEVRDVTDPSETTYTVTVATDGNGTASASPVSGVSGTVVTLTATPNSGYRFREWIVLYGGVTITSNQFTIGSADVSVIAVFEEIPQTVFNVTVTTDGHGTATASPSSGETGTEVSLTAIPYIGYRFRVWQVLSGSVAIVNDRFTIGSADVSIRAVFEQHDPSPTPSNFARQYTEYLAGLGKPFRKLVRLEFLQFDNTVAFALGGAGQKIPIAGRDTRTFLQSGSVSVNLANGSRRKATVVLSNRDGAFDYAVNHLWFGQRVRISMGMRLPSGEDFYFPMGVFYVENPSVLFSPGEKTATLNLTDKWAYLDGSLFGTLEAAYSVTAGTNIFSAMDSLLRLSRYTMAATTELVNMIDPTTAVYTTYFNGKTYQATRSDGSITSDISMTATPYAVTENRGSTMAALILKLNEMLAGWIGYDAAGALRLEPSQDDIADADKPVLFAFTPENSVLLSHSSTAQNTAVYNDVTIGGQGLTDKAVWARAVNDDPSSDTNVNLIGRRVYVEEKADYWNADQCAALARWTLKRKTVLQKSVTIECGQMFHLVENQLVSVKRTDKPGSPVEKHLIQGFTIPIAETGGMSISCVSVNDIPEFNVTITPSL